MSKHTPEPWKLWGDKEAIVIWGDKEAIVMDKPLHSKHGFIAIMACNEDVSARTSSANARRIVTCVNACAGMADPAVEIAELKRQRDELLEALEAAVECGIVPLSSAKEGGAAKYARQVVVADQIRDSIAKTKGGAS